MKHIRRDIDKEQFKGIQRVCRPPQSCVSLGLLEPLLAFPHCVCLPTLAFIALPDVAWDVLFLCQDFFLVSRLNLKTKASATNSGKRCANFTLPPTPPSKLQSAMAVVPIHVAHCVDGASRPVP